MAQMTARLYVRMPDALLEALILEAERRYSRPSDVARQAIAEYLEKRNANGGTPAPVAADAPRTAADGA